MARKAKKVIPKTFSLERFLTKINKEGIRADQDVQRLSGQFDNSMINELIVTVLTDDYIPEIILAEEDKVKQLWIIDGLQRSSSLTEFRFGNYKITSTIEDSIIEYDTQVVDDNGQVRKDEDGNIMWKTIEFDIKNKTYSDLPNELKDIFNEYQIKTVVHQNCTMKQISKLIRRYNNHKAMNSVQKAFTYIDDFARNIRELTNHRFFKDCGVFTEKEKIRGVYNRVICESVMAMFHLDKWKSSPKAICSYLNNEATIEEFDEFEKCLDKLKNIVEKDDSIFNSKNSFIWITLFYRFTKLGLRDNKFVDFLNEFKKTLHNKNLNVFENFSFDEYDKNKGTKDKKVVTNKINGLETLMNEFLHINIVETESNVDVKTDNEEVVETLELDDAIGISDQVKDYAVGEFSTLAIADAFNLESENDILGAVSNSLKFVNDNLDSTDAVEDTELYISILNDWIRDMFQIPSLSKELLPAFVGVVGYACIKEIDNVGAEWFSDFVDGGDFTGEGKTVSENYTYMTNTLDTYVNLAERMVV